MPLQPGAVKRLWWRWKAIRLPWRRRWLCGFDLNGNTFWEFTDKLNAGRYRRIVDYATKTHLSDVNLSPQWVQWLRHTRFEPPSINEQQMDEIRRAQMKQLAAQADARWAAKPSALDRPSQQQLPSATPEVATLSGTPQMKQITEQVHETPARPIAEEMIAQKVEEPAPTLATPVVPKEFTGYKMPMPTTTKPKKQKDFTGYKLGKADEQQPGSWVPKPARRR